ncbi:MAG: hypothetical protein JNL32_11975 [Candidatus Kapabacteria bacterium]|nr:hypothetical protein [Candidatus Kapabacteria bacterium]
MTAVSGLSQPAIQSLRDTTRSDNTARIGMDKIANTFLFRANADIAQRVFGGELTISQNYSGSTVRSLSAAFRDDQQFQLGYSIPVDSTFQILTQGLWLYSRDSRSLGLSSLERSNASAGLRYKYDNYIMLEAVAGAERATQSLVRDVGTLLSVNGRAQNIQLDNYDVSAQLRSEYISFTERTNSDIDAQLGLRREYDARNYLTVLATHRNLRRDFYSLSSLNAAPVTTLETRFERRTAIDAATQFGVLKNISADIQATFGFASVNRGYARPLEGLNNTSVQRDLSELSVNVQAKADYADATSYAQAGIASFYRDEENTALKKFDGIGDDLLDTVKLLERIRDNSTSRVRLFASGGTALSKRDSITVSASISILRYDTPSVLNNDDRDEQNILFHVVFFRQFSPYLRGVLSFQTQQTNIVFLKSQRSSLNNWNRVYRLAPSCDIDVGRFHAQPQCEVLAQYTVYDFEGMPSVPQSFSFRQIAIRDSLIIPLYHSASIETRFYLRYFERGELFWSSFSERPVSKNYEQFIRPLVWVDAGTDCRVAAGIRWYALSQQNIVTPNAVNTLLESIAPECSLEWTLERGTQLRVNGWYEFQYQNRIAFRRMPNISITLLRPL